MSANSSQIIDQRLVRAISNPLRVEILEAIVEEGELSPVQIAKRLGQRVSTVSYHVNTLRQCEVIELVRTRKRRGALEHFFRPAATVPSFLELARSAFS